MDSEAVMTTPTWVVAYTAAGVLQAQILRGLLEAAGLPVQIAQEGAGAVYAFTVGPMGEADLLVPADRLEEARALLAEYERGTLASTAEDAGSAPGPEPGEPEEAA
jgi:hypothetical protein